MGFNRPVMDCRNVDFVYKSVAQLQHAHIPSMQMYTVQTS